MGPWLSQSNAAQGVSTTFHKIQICLPGWALVPFSWALSWVVGNHPHACVALLRISWAPMRVVNGSSSYSALPRHLEVPRKTVLPMCSGGEFCGYCVLLCVSVCLARTALEVRNNLRNDLAPTLSLVGGLELCLWHYILLVLSSLAQTPAICLRLEL